MKSRAVAGCFRFSSSSPSRNDALRGTADADQHVDARLGTCGCDGTGHVSVGNQPDSGTGVADLLDQLTVPGSVENAYGDVGHRRFPGLGDAADVLRNRAVMSMASAASGPTAIFSM
jgi:hypothetical protein